MPLLPLFDDESAPTTPLAERLSALASQRIYIGTSSWKYPGWLGKIYHPERYMTRGRFSQKKFEAECLAEYAETFPIVCGDFTFYQFPTDDQWSKLFLSASKSLLYAFKAPEEITVPYWPAHPRYGARAGETNPNFLNVAMFRDLFLGPLEPFRSQVAVIVFEFGPLAQSAFANAQAFAEHLARFLDQLPGSQAGNGWRYSVEIRNPEFLSPYYFDCLRKRGVAHVFNSWSRMPEITTQLNIPGAHTSDFTVARALLRQGRPYEQAVKMLAPYDEVRDVYAAGRRGLRSIVDRALYEKGAAFLFVNNRFEGHAPATIRAIVEDATEAA